MNAWWNNTLNSIRLEFREKQTMFWNFAFPLFFLFIFSSVFARGKPEVVSYLLPGLLCINMMSAGFFGFSIGLVTARERGILRRYQLTPFPAWMLISSEIATSFVIAGLALGVQLTAAKVIYRVTIAGNPLVLGLMVGAGTLAFLSLGFLIASVADNAKIAQVIGNMLFFPLMFLGGAAFPKDMLPKSFQRLAEILPSSYVVDALKRVIVDGQGLSQNLTNLTVLLTTCGCAIFVAAKLFRWNAQEPMPLEKKLWALSVVAIFVAAALFIR
ncbi:MAG: ABC transporter permease [Blastocatellia bacterium]|nr:ABC transporter permease [Blastocatellia bacterium]